MNLLFIHGIAQEDFEEVQLRDKWRDVLVNNAVNPNLFLTANCQMAYYGKVLDQAANWFGSGGVSMGRVAMGVEQAGDAEAKFMLAIMQEIVAAENISQAAIDKAMVEVDIELGKSGIAPMSTVIGRTIVSIFSAIEKISPAKGGLAAHVLRQAYVYLRSPGVAPRIDVIIKKKIDEMVPQDAEDRRIIVVSHSLGTIVAFKVLRDLAPAGAGLQIPLLITAGSPLASEQVRNHVGLPRGRPAIVASWRNYLDKGDVVTLGRQLTPETFGRDIDNDGTVANFKMNNHGIEGYLSHPALVAELESLLRAG